MVLSRTHSSLIYILLLLTIAFNLKGQGLQFNANDSLLIKRTSYNVFASGNTTFRHHLLISFDLSVWDRSNLGYILNVADKENSYSLSYLFNNDTGYLNFNIDAKSNKIKIPLSQTLLVRKKWMKVVISFDLDKDAIDIAINNKNYHADKLGLNGTIAARLVFGKNPLYTEVPHIAIKNLSVSDDKKYYFFPLNEWSGNNVHDEKGDIVGYVENPFWLTRESYFWKPVFIRSFKQVAGLNFNPLDGNLSIFSKDSLITYNAFHKDVVVRPYKNAIPVNMVLGKNILNTKENRVYIYELFDVHTGETSVASLNLDLNNLEWQPVGKATLASQLHHHNMFYDATGDTIYLFGGYGNYKYHNTFLYYDKQADAWKPQIFTGDKITPRFFSATGPSDKLNEIFLFGGYGNESGNQVIGGKQYYDLYRINVQNHTIKKCWQIQPDSGVFVPANNLILSPDKQYFYALCYPHEMARTALALYKFSIKDGSYEIVSAPILVISERIESDINLFFDSNTNEFFCTVQEFTDRHNSTIKLFSLEGPPLSRQLYLQSLEPEKSSQNYIPYIIGIFVVIGTIAGIVLMKRKKRQSIAAAMDQQMVGEIENESPETETILHTATQNAIYILGDFLVYDAKGMDITHLFSPKIKQLFVLILINSINGEGINSRKISSALWPDKEYAKTKNIRGVTFNHLRNVISNITGLELNFSGDNYFFKTGEEVFCDYAVVAEILDSGELTAANLPVILRGSLLHDMHDAWLETDKYEYEQRLINLLIHEAKLSYNENNLKQTLEISRYILKIEPFNEEALKYEIAALKKLKGSDYARKIFDQRTAEYRRSLGDDSPLKFEDIIF